MSTFHVLSAAALLALLSQAAHADSFRTPPLKAGVPLSIQAYGRQNPRCAEWTNGCVVCVAAGGHTQCSTAGIACTPAGLTCRRPTKP